MNKPLSSSKLICHLQWYLQWFCFIFCFFLLSIISSLSLPGCLPNQFECRYGECIDESQRCDHFKDCSNTVDEIGCGMLAILTYLPTYVLSQTWPDVTTYILLSNTNWKIISGGCFQRLVKRENIKYQEMEANVMVNSCGMRIACSSLCYCSPSCR